MGLKEKDVISLVEATNKMKNDLKEKDQEKRWRPITVSLSLQDSLNRLAKYDLDSIRKKLEIKNASSLKKAELIQLLEEEIPASLEKIARKLDKERHSLLTELARNGGHMTAPSLETRQFNYFLKNGILFTGTFEGERVLVMPQEIVDAFSKIEDTTLQPVIHRNTEWIKLTKGALYYFGSLQLAQLVEIVESKLGEELSVREYLSVIEDALSYYKEVKLDEKGFYYRKVLDPEQVQREHKSRRTIGYYPFSKVQLMTAGEVGFVDRNDSFKRFVDYLDDTFEMTREEAVVIVEELMYATKNGKAPQELLAYLQTRVSFDRIDSLRAAMDRIIDLMNQTREWFLKGYTSEEVSALEKKSLQPLPSKVIDIHTKKKIGRNDPCPCGSEKKYKKCCGR